MVTSVRWFFEGGQNGARLAREVVAGGRITDGFMHRPFLVSFILSSKREVDRVTHESAGNMQKNERICFFLREIFFSKIFQVVAVA